MSRVLVLLDRQLETLPTDHPMLRAPDPLVWLLSELCRGVYRCGERDCSRSATCRVARYAVASQLHRCDDCGQALLQHFRRRPSPYGARGGPRIVAVRNADAIRVAEELLR